MHTENLQGKKPLSPQHLELGWVQKTRWLRHSQMGLGLKGWLRALAGLAEVWFPAPIWQLITTVTRILEETDTLFWP